MTTPNGSPVPPDSAIRLELPSRPTYLCAVRCFVGEVCRRHSFTELQTSQIVLAVDEALANVMRHGYEGNGEGRIVVKVDPITDSAKGPGLKFTMDDWGRQVDPASIKGRDLEDIRPGGLGVHIIRRVMDSAVYEAPAGQGMRLTMTKFVSSPAAVGDGLGCEGGGCGCEGGQNG